HAAGFAARIGQAHRRRRLSAKAGRQRRTSAHHPRPDRRGTGKSTRRVMSVGRVHRASFWGAVFAIACGLLPCVAAAPPWPSCDRLVIPGDPEYPPPAWYDGQTRRGASIAGAVATAQQLHLPYELRYVGPFPRVLLAARNGEIDVIS